MINEANGVVFFIILFLEVDINMSKMCGLCRKFNSKKYVPDFVLCKYVPEL